MVTGIGDGHQTSLFAKILIILRATFLIDCRRLLIISQSRTCGQMQIPTTVCGIKRFRYSRLRMVEFDQEGVVNTNDGISFPFNFRICQLSVELPRPTPSSFLEEVDKSKNIVS
jgi:hypothetical protein